MQVKWKDLFEAFELVSCAEPGAMEAYLELSSGKLFYASDYADDDEEDPTFIDAADADPERFIAIPNQRELHLGKSLALDFAAAHLAGHYDEIDRIFQRRGAYSQFKAILHNCGALEKWCAFETEAAQQSLRQWAADNDIQIIE